MILIATPTRDSVTAGFAADLVKLCRRSPDTRFVAMLGIYVAALRQSAVSMAQQTGASHLLFLDADMRFPDDTLERLLAWDVDIVGANYVQRTMPIWWVSLLNGVPVSSVNRVGLESVDSTGFGVMLVKLTALDRLPTPWFDTPFDGTQHLGEDLYFCRHARAHRFSINIDHDLSQAVRHQGTVEHSAQSFAAQEAPYAIR